MECEPRSGSFRDRMRRQAVRAGVPLTGMMELTRRCQFRCPHCYAGPASTAAGELGTDDWKRLLDEAAEAGCLNLVFTGGEPLLRPDFEALYIHARKKGLAVTLFTNGGLVDDQAAALFHEWPPFSVEVSVYGITEETAKRVTGVEGACAAQWAGIRRLKAAGVPVTLKVLATRPLRGEVEAIEARAREEGFRFRLSVELTPRLNGDPAPMGLALDPAEAAALEAREPGFAEALKARRASRRNTDRCYPCAAGQYGFFVDAEGWLQPCLALRGQRLTVRTGGLYEAWKRVVSEARSGKVGVDRKRDDRLLYESFVCVGLTEWSGKTPSVFSWRKHLAEARAKGVL